jgi:hypothetical protein
MSRPLLVFLLSALVATTAAAQAKGKSYLIGIESVPPGAEITIDGRSYGPTPFRNKVPEGNHELVLTKEGYEPLSTRLVIERASYKKTFSYNLVKAVLNPTLSIQAKDDTAEGAEIAIDGAPAGTIPLQTTLPVGRHFVEMKKAGFLSYSEWVELSEGGTSTLSITLTPEKKGASLRVEGTAGAQVFLDGMLVGESPLSLEKLGEGRHLVQVKKEGFVEYSEWIEFKEAEVSTVAATLSPRSDIKKTGALRVFTSVDTLGQEPANVYLDGELLGPTPLTKEVAPGDHLLEVRKAGFERYEQKISVYVSAEQVIKVALVPTGQGPGTLRVISPLTEAEVFIDGASAGLAPVLLESLSPGQHIVVVRKAGYKDFEAKVVLSAETPAEVIADLRATGVLKVIANLSGAQIFLDGELLQVTTASEGVPVVLKDIAVGSHQVMVRLPKHNDAIIDTRVVAGEEAVADVTLSPINRRLPRAERRRRIATYSGRTIETGDFALDLMTGIPDFFEASAYTGARERLEAGVSLRSNVYLHELHARAKYTVVDTPIFSLAGEGGLGGGFGTAKSDLEENGTITKDGGDTRLSTTSFSTFANVIASLHFKDQFAFSLRAGGLFYTDGAPDVNGFGAFVENGKKRDTALRLNAGFAAQYLQSERLSYNFVFESSPIGVGEEDPDPNGSGERIGRALYAIPLGNNDPRLYARLGVTFKF